MSLYKEAWSLFNSSQMNPEFASVAARRESELNGKYRHIIEQLQLPEGSPMHQYLKHHWDNELQQLHQDYTEGLKDTDAYVEQHRKYRNEGFNSSPPPQPEPSLTREERKQAVPRKGLGVAGGALTATGLAGLGGAGGYAAVQGSVPRRGDANG